MRTIITDTISGRVSVPVYTIYEIPYTEIMLQAKESKKNRSCSYLEIPCAFDIETTNVYKRLSDGKIDPDFRPFAFMYHWQICIGYRVAFARTWEDFTAMLSMIERDMNLSNKLRLVIYIHNLAFEMQFMRKFLNVTESFCKDDRRPLKVVHNGCIEFRCSAALSNMNLQMFCKSENATFYKLVDTFDYKKIRTQETEMTESEESYSYNDVRGLSECIQSLMRFDSLARMPLTSTGFVRRDARKAVKENKKNRRIFKDSALSADDYRNLRAAFRGGDTHANARFSDQVLQNVSSYDISSSYPACMMIDKYPMSKFVPIKIETFIRLRKEKDKYCFLLHVALTDIVFEGKHGIPYIALAKTKYHSTDRILDNGRIRKASLVTMWVSDIDMDIITSEYTFSELKIESVYVARAELLPIEYRNVVMDYFRKKTGLKGKDDLESLYLYGKSKNKLNALYGMMVMRIDQAETTYTGKTETGYETLEKPLDEILDKYYRSRNSFLPYQWGVWVTIHARKRLRDMMNLIGRDLVYVDTDSVKFLNHEKHVEAIRNHNEILRVQAETAGAFADDPQGDRHYMGVFEFDGRYDQFKTLGAKKYVVEIDGQCYSTIAGVSRKAGQEFFNENGIEAFEIGSVIRDSGHLVAYYNDDEIHEIEIEGCKMVTASNVALIDDTYTIGVTDDYKELLKSLIGKRYDLD